MYWGTNRFYLDIPKKSLMVFSFIVCVYNPVLPACYSNCCFLESSLLKTFFDKLLMMVVCGSGLKWSEESWCSEFLDFFLNSIEPPVLSLSVFGRLPCSISTYFSISPACCLLVASSSTTHKFTVCRVHSCKLALKGFLTGICLFPK